MMTDMTKGSPFKILLKFVIPLLLSMVFQQMYNLADSVIAGRYLGVEEPPLSPPSDSRVSSSRPQTW